jgi:hypothetical protein
MIWAAGRATLVGADNRPLPIAADKRYPIRQ